VLGRGALLAKAAGSVDRSAEVESLVLRLFDQHHGLERIDVVDPLLLALRWDLSLVRPVVELHLRNAGDLTDLAQGEHDLAQVLGEVDRLEEVYLSTGHVFLISLRGGTPCFKGIPLWFAKGKGFFQNDPL